MRKAVILLGLILLSTAIRARHEVRLSMFDCINLAADSSLQAFRVQNMYLSSYWEHRSYKASRLPSLTLRTTPLSYNRDITKRYDSQNDVDIYRQQQTMQSYGNLSLSQNVAATGGTLYVDSELGYIRNTGDNRFSQFSSVPIRIGYQQSLFGFNSYKWEKKIEPLKFEKAKKQYIYDQEAISETAIQYFFNFAMADIEHRMAVAAVASADTLYHIGAERQKIAAISQSDLLTLELEKVNSANSLKNAEIMLKRSMFGLISFLNLDREMQLELDLPQTPDGLTIPIGLALDMVKENNPDFMGFTQRLNEAEREVERTRKSSVFDASLSVSVGFNQVANNFYDAYRNPLQQDVVSVGLAIPLLDWGKRKGQANMARNNLNVTKISLQQEQLSLEEEVIMTVSEFNIQQSLIDSAKEAMRLATMAYNTTKERFIIGKADLNSLTLSLERQNSAQRNYIQSLRNYWMSYYKLRKLTLYDFRSNQTLSAEFDRLHTID